MIHAENLCLILRRLLLSGFRSVLENVTDSSLRLKIRSVFRDLVPSHRATCMIASRVNSGSLSLILQLVCKTIIVHKLPLRFLIWGVVQKVIFESDLTRNFCIQSTGRAVLDKNFHPERENQMFFSCAKNCIPSH